jgi:hypothetical protein
MRTIEIPRTSWLETLNEFSTAHEGAPVWVDVLGSEIGAQPEVQDLPLIGVVADPRERDGTITVSAAKEGFEHIAHIIKSPRRVWIERTDEGDDIALQIESDEGSKTIVRFSGTERADRSF